tara:strand:- start:28579 stop:28773 length:195 start_codon:yes stop_codon:yes gene_type:complete
MAIFIYCNDCEKTVEPNSCGHKKELFRNDTRNYVNMRSTWSGQTQVEFSQTTVGEDIVSRGGEL